MAELVEGEWKDFVFKMITEEDHPKILANLQSVFFRDEPISSLLGVHQNEDMMEDMTNIARFLLEKNDGLSFYALDKRNGEIAGIRVTYKASDDDPKEFPFEMKSQTIGAVFMNVMQLGVESNVFESYGIKYYGELMFTSVNPNYRGQGLVSEIYKRTFALLRAKGYPLCKVMFTNPLTYKCGIKFGFKEHARRRFLDFKNEKGDLLLPNAGQEQVAIIMALKL